MLTAKIVLQLLAFLRLFQHSCDAFTLFSKNKAFTVTSWRTSSVSSGSLFLSLSSDEIDGGSLDGAVPDDDGGMWINIGSDDEDNKSSGSSSQTPVNEESNESNILRRVDKWACVRNCGACCKLGPLSSRPDLQEYLTSDEFSLYQSMIGPDDWCKHFDQESRMCTIYDERPAFCRVEPLKFKAMYGVDEEDLNVC